MKKAIIVDLDGTLCNVEHRVSHVLGEEKDWKSFNEALVHDTIYDWCQELIRVMHKEQYKVLFVTGRGEDYRDLTVNWLSKNNVSYHQLYMRKSNDFREDNEVKLEIYRGSIEQHYQVLFVLDDRLSVVKMWRDIGLVCLQCDWGNF